MSAETALNTTERESVPAAREVCCGGVTDWLPADDAAELASRLGAVADPVRLQILSLISGAPSGEICACDFVTPIGKSQPTISHHLKVLAEAGLIEGEKRGRWVWYRLVDGPVRQLVGDLADVTAKTD